MQPIGYGDARRLLETMGGEEAPEAWRGGLQGLTYRFHASSYSLIEDFVCFLLFLTCIKCSPEYPRLGPGPDAAHQRWRVRLVTHNYLEDKEDSNIIGLIRGEEEPDRFGLI